MRNIDIVAFVTKADTRVKELVATHNPLAEMALAAAQFDLIADCAISLQRIARATEHLAVVSGQGFEP